MHLFLFLFNIYCILVRFQNFLVDNISPDNIPVFVKKEEVEEEIMLLYVLNITI